MSHIFSIGMSYPICIIYGCEAYTHREWIKDGLSCVENSWCYLTATDNNVVHSKWFPTSKYVYRSVLPRWLTSHHKTWSALSPGSHFSKPVDILEAFHGHLGNVSHRRWSYSVFSVHSRTLGISFAVHLPVSSDSHSSWYFLYRSYLAAWFDGLILFSPLVNAELAY